MTWHVPAYAMLAIGIVVLAAESAPARGRGGPLLPAADKVLIGRWRIEFSNGVTAICEVAEDRTVSFVELAVPKYFGTSMLKDGANIIEYSGRRIERWTPVGDRMIVEHWYPDADFPDAKPVLGIADRLPSCAQGTLRYKDGKKGFSLSVPENWAAVPASFIVQHYREVFLCINNRGNKELRLTDNLGTAGGYRPEKELEPGTVYIELCHSWGPPQIDMTTAPDTVKSDLAAMLKEARTITSEGALSMMHLSFVRHERPWIINVYFREPVAEDVRTMALDVLRSIHWADTDSVGK